jgi:uncharacterized repeat protein (TIGR01451 family)
MTENMGILSQIRHRLLGAPAVAIALSLVMAQTNAAFAAIDNTVTVTATQPGGGAYLPAPTATESVDVADDTPTLDVVKAHTLTKGPGNLNAAAEPGDTINYTYTVENTGNVTLTNVSVIDQHDFPAATSALPGVLEPTTVTDNQPGGASAGQTGDSTDGTLADGIWDTLGPGDIAVFTGSHTVTAADLNANGGGVTSDGDIDNTATVSGDYNDGTTTVTVSDSSSDSVPLFLQPLLTVTKVADDETDVVAGQVITYTYTVTNGGNVDMSAISLSDTHKGVVGALTPVFQSFSPGGLGSTNTGNLINVLKPGDSAVFEAQYTVTQDDVDNLQ